MTLATVSSISRSRVVQSPERIEIVSAVNGAGLNPQGPLISIVNTGEEGRAIKWVVNTDVDWLGAQPTSGLCRQGETDDISLRIEAEYLTPGNHAALLTVSCDELEIIQNIPVALTVLPVRISPPSLDIVVMEGGPDYCEPLTIENAEEEPEDIEVDEESGLTWTAAVDAEWLTLRKLGRDEELRRYSNGISSGEAEGLLGYGLGDQVSLIPHVNDYDSERTYDAEINITINDLAQTPLTVPVTLSVLRGKRLIDSLPGVYHHSQHQQTSRPSRNLGQESPNGRYNNEPARDETQISLDGFLRLFEGVLGPVERMVDNLSYYFDPMMTPEDMLDWIARWLDFTLDPSWPIERRRELVASAIELYKWRGTRRGLQRYLEVYAGVRPEIFEDIGGFTLDEHSWLAENTFLGEGTANVIRVRLNIPRTQHVRIEKVRQIIESEKPAHLAYTLDFISQGERIEDDDSQVIEASTPVGVGHA